MRIVGIVIAAFAVAACTATPDPAPEPTVSPTARLPATATDGPVPVRQRSAAPLLVPRTEVTGTTWRGLIVVAGGLTADGAASPLVHAYDAGRDSWEQLPNLPVPLHHTSLAVLAGDLYVVGGYSGGRPWVPERRVWVLSSGAEAWRDGPPLTAARGALAVASTGDALVAIGGVGPDGTHRSAEALRDLGRGWDRLPSLVTAREHLAATTGPEGVLAIAGRDGGLTTNRDSVELFTGNEWQSAPSLGHARGGTSAATVRDVPCVVGGEEPGGTIAPVECLVGGRWVVVADLAVPRHGLAVAALDNRLHVIGGGPEPGLTVSDAHEVLEFVNP